MKDVSRGHTTLLCSFSNFSHNRWTLQKALLARRKPCCFDALDIVGWHLVPAGRKRHKRSMNDSQPRFILKNVAMGPWAIDGKALQSSVVTLMALECTFLRHGAVGRVPLLMESRMLPPHPQGLIFQKSHFHVPTIPSNSTIFLLMQRKSQTSLWTSLTLLLCKIRQDGACRHHF